MFDTSDKNNNNNNNKKKQEARRNNSEVMIAIGTSKDKSKSKKHQKSIANKTQKGRKLPSEATVATTN